MILKYLFGKRILVQDRHQALLFIEEKFIRILESGNHLILGKKIRVQEVDTREASLVVNGQEVLTSDLMTLKISVVLRYEVANVELALRSVQKYWDDLYFCVQDSLRKVVALKKLDELLAQREQIIEAMTSMVTKQAERLGVKVLSLTLRDFMLSGELKQAYAEMTKARLEGQAALERARGESAAIRHLLNVTQLMESHPGLLQLRYLQSIDHAVTNGKGHTLMVGLPKDMAPIIPAHQSK